jgi:hypothetical protein
VGFAAAPNGISSSSCHEKYKCIPKPQVRAVRIISCRGLDKIALLRSVDAAPEAGQAERLAAWRCWS